LAQAYYDKLKWTTLAGIAKSEWLSKGQKAQRTMTDLWNTLLSMDQIALLATGWILGKWLWAVVSKSATLSRWVYLAQWAIESSKALTAAAKIIPWVSVIAWKAWEWIILQLWKFTLNFGFEIAKFVAIEKATTKTFWPDAWHAVSMAMMILPWAKSAFQDKMAMEFATDAVCGWEKYAKYMISKYWEARVHTMVEEWLLLRSREQSMTTWKLDSASLKKIKDLANYITQNLKKVASGSKLKLSDFVPKILMNDVWSVWPGTWEKIRARGRTKRWTPEFDAMKPFTTEDLPQIKERIRECLTANRPNRKDFDSIIPEIIEDIIKWRKTIYEIFSKYKLWRNSKAIKYISRELQELNILNQDWRYTFSNRAKTQVIAAARRVELWIKHKRPIQKPAKPGPAKEPAKPADDTTKGPKGEPTDAEWEAEPIGDSTWEAPKDDAEWVPPKDEPKKPGDKPWKDWAEGYDTSHMSPEQLERFKELLELRKTFLQDINLAENMIEKIKHTLRSWKISAKRRQLLNEQVHNYEQSILWIRSRLRPVEEEIESLLNLGTWDWVHWWPGNNHGWPWAWDPGAWPGNWGNWDPGAGPWRGPWAWDPWAWPNNWNAWQWAWPWAWPHAWDPGAGPWRWPWAWDPGAWPHVWPDGNPIHDVPLDANWSVIDSIKNFFWRNKKKLAIWAAVLVTVWWAAMLYMVTRKSDWELDVEEVPEEKTPAPAGPSAETQPPVGSSGNGQDTPPVTPVTPVAPEYPWDDKEWDKPETEEGEWNGTDGNDWEEWGNEDGNSGVAESWKKSKWKWKKWEAEAAPIPWKRRKKDKEPQGSEGSGETMTLAEKIRKMQENLWKDIKEIDKNRKKELEKIWLWDAFFWLDKAIELDENPIRLDYDWFTDWRITVNDRWEYVITLDDRNKTQICSTELFDVLKNGWETILKIDKANR
jgi:hypothetical protein